MGAIINPIGVAALAACHIEIAVAQHVSALRWRQVAPQELHAALLGGLAAGGGAWAGCCSARYIHLPSDAVPLAHGVPSLAAIARAIGLRPFGVALSLAAPIVSFLAG